MNGVKRPQNIPLPLATERGHSAYWEGLGYTLIRSTQSKAERRRSKLTIHMRAPRVSMACPQCRSFLVQQPEGPGLAVHDLPVDNQQTVLYVFARSWHCLSCDRILRDTMPGIDAILRITRRLAEWIATHHNRSEYSVVAETGVGLHTVRALAQDARLVRYGVVEGTPDGFLLPEVVVERHVQAAHRYDMFAKSIAKTPLCPFCGANHIVQSNGYQPLAVHDVPHEGRCVVVIFKHSRRACRACGKTFRARMVAVDDRMPWLRLTKRLIDWVAGQAGRRTPREIAEASGVPLIVVQKILRRAPLGLSGIVPPIAPPWQTLPGVSVTAFSEDASHYYLDANVLPDQRVCANCHHTVPEAALRQARKIFDIPINGKQVVIRLRTVVLRCKHCGAAAEQDVPEIDLKRKMTRRWAQQPESPVEARNITASIRFERLFVQTRHSDMARRQKWQLGAPPWWTPLVGVHVQAHIERADGHYLYATSGVACTRCALCDALALAPLAIKKHTVRDRPAGDKLVFLCIIAKAWLCERCGEHTNALPPGIELHIKVTHRLMQWIADERLGRPLARIAEDLGLGKQWLYNLCWRYARRNGRSCDAEIGQAVSETDSTRATTLARGQ